MVAKPKNYKWETSYFTAQAIHRRKKGQRKYGDVFLKEMFGLNCNLKWNEMDGVS